MYAARSKKKFLKPLFLSIGFILLISYFTYFHHYDTPEGLFWDENYYIPSAQKYLNGIFFMHPHPPLGQILIALGERIIHANTINDQSIGTEFATTLPQGFSLRGYRFIPVLLGWFTAPVIFGIFLLLTRNYLFAILLSYLYVFDNALIVHLRGAMLESSFLFFATLTLLCFLLLLEWKKYPRRFAYCSILFGIFFGLLNTIKPNGLILILLIPALCFRLFPNWKKCFTFVSLSAFGFILVFVTVWQVHFTLASQINPSLPNNGYYEASEQYKQILTVERNNSLFSFPVMLRDSLKYASNYHKKVPHLNLCKLDENGSPPFFWIFGARAINYKWETPDGKNYKYLYLQSNPVVWAVGLLGVILASALLISSIFLPLQEKLQHRYLLATFLVLYLVYMLAMSNINRVMYLYHYFLPLLFSFFLFGLSFLEISRLGRWRLNEKRKTLILLYVVLCICLSYQFYRPLTYYEPITDDSFKKRMILPLWDLRCIKCETEKLLVGSKNS